MVKITESSSPLPLLQHVEREHSQHRERFSTSELSGVNSEITPETHQPLDSSAFSRRPSRARTAIHRSSSELSASSFKTAQSSSQRFDDAEIPLEALFIRKMNDNHPIHGQNSSGEFETIPLEILTESHHSTPPSSPSTLSQRALATLKYGKDLASAGFHQTSQAIAKTIPINGLRAWKTDRQFLGAAAGHFVHQTTAVGISIFGADLLNEVLLAAFRHIPKNHLIAMQAASGTAQLAMHRLRQYREQRAPEAAARGFHNLNQEEWDALSDTEKQEKMAIQRQYSDSVTMMALASIMTNLSLGAGGESLGDPMLPAKLLAADLKSAAYAAGRDTIQALFSMVTSDPPKRGIGGVSGPSVSTAGNLYAAANATANILASSLSPPDLKLARDKIAQFPSPLSLAQAMTTIVKSAGNAAIINSLLETSDWISINQEAAKYAGVKQKWGPKILGKREDLLRILDHSVTRTAVVNSNISIANAVATLARTAKLPNNIVSNLSNLIPALAISFQYGTIAGTWQAEAVVRSERDARPKEIDHA